jgi:uncharacterized membrane protein
VVVAIKGLDGALELAAGLILLVAPRLTGSALEVLTAEFAEGTVPLHAAAALSIAAAHGGSVTGAAPLAGFLVIQGVVKLTVVSVLRSRAVRWYPWALVVLSALFLLQVVDLITAPVVGGWLLVALDVVVILLVAGEYERFRHERLRRPRPSSRVNPTASTPRDRLPRRARPVRHESGRWPSPP